MRIVVGTWLAWVVIYALARSLSDGYRHGRVSVAGGKTISKRKAPARFWFTAVVQALLLAAILAAWTFWLARIAGDG